MIRTATQTRHIYIPLTKPKASFRHAFAFICDLCHDLNRYMDAAHKVYVPEENNLRRRTKLPD